jgi:hypothetical protein
VKVHSTEPFGGSTTEEQDFKPVRPPEAAKDNVVKSIQESSENSLDDYIKNRVPQFEKPNENPHLKLNPKSNVISILRNLRNEESEVFQYAKKLRIKRAFGRYYTASLKFENIYMVGSKLDICT